MLLHHNVTMPVLACKDSTHITRMLIPTALTCKGRASMYGMSPQAMTGFCRMLALAQIQRL